MQNERLDSLKSDLEFDSKQKRPYRRMDTMDKYNVETCEF